MSKLERHAHILRLIDERDLATQEEVVRALHDEGLDAVQATVSRDIAQLGLIKVRRNGRLVYARPGAADQDRLAALSAALRRLATGVEAAGNLVILRTPPGHANALALALDAAALPDVVGCIAGDDTIFLAVRDGRSAPDLARQLVELDE